MLYISKFFTQMENRTNLKPLSSMNNTHQIRNSTAEFLIFATQNESDTIEVRYEIGTLWLSQKWMAKLFDCSSDNISLHLKNIFVTGELNPNSVTEDCSTTAPDGKTYRVKHYNLDAIIAVGYHVNSRRATQFAKAFAEGEFEKFRIRQDKLYQSEFDRFLAEAQNESPKNITEERQ